MDERIGEWVMREEPMLLTAAELQLRQNPPKDFGQPRRVYAWVRYPHPGRPRPSTRHLVDGNGTQDPVPRTQSTPPLKAGSGATRHTRLAPPHTTGWNDCMVALQIPSKAASTRLRSEPGYALTYG